MTTGTPGTAAAEAVLGLDGTLDQRNTRVITSFLRNSRGAIFNEDSNDSDFRVESDSNTHMLFVDAGTDRVGIAKSDPAFPLDVRSDGGTSFATNSFPISNMAGGGYIRVIDAQNVVDNILSGIQFTAFNGDAVIAASYDTTNAASLIFGTENSGTITERTRIESNGFLKHGSGATFNELGNDSDFRVESDGNSYMLFVDAGNNRVAINDSSPAYTFTVSRTGGETDVALLKGNVGNSLLRLQDSDSTTDFSIGSDDGALGGSGFIIYD